MTAKRAFDLALTLPGLVLAAPFFLVVAVWIKWDSPGPVFFRQTRIGRKGRPFRIFKLRTMVPEAEQVGETLTTGGDPRITRAGRFLRKYKLDELPQLINVVKGEMSLVGPRPEVPEYIAFYPEEAKEKVLSVPPGITDWAALEFASEDELLAQAADPRDYYIREILPRKLAYYEAYVNSRTLWKDFVLIARTLGTLLRKGG